MKKRTFILGLAAHLCKFPTACRFVDDMSPTPCHIQEFLNSLYTGYRNLEKQCGEYKYVNFRKELAELSTYVEDDDPKVLTFHATDAKDVDWTQTEATCAWLSMLGTPEGDIVERQRKLCKAIAPVIPKYDGYEGLYSFHLWGAFWAELDCSALVEFED